MRRRPPGRRPSPAYLILGEDPYLRRLLRDEIIAAHVPPEARGMAVVHYSLEQTPLAEAVRQALMPPLFSSRQVLVLSLGEAVNDDQLPPLEQYLDSPSDFTVLVFEAERLDRRTRSARLLLERCEVRAADSPGETDAVRTALDFARQLGLSLTREAADEMVFLLGTDQGRLRAELEKLRSFAGPRGEVTPADVAALVAPARQFSVFELADLLAERRRAEVLVRLRRLLEAGESPVGIVGLLGWLYRQLVQAQALPRNTPAWKAAQALRAPRTRVEGLVRQARRFQPAELRGAFAALLEADVALKSSPPDPAAILEALVVRLTVP